MVLMAMLLRGVRARPAQRGVRQVLPPVALEASAVPKSSRATMRASRRGTNRGWQINHGAQAQ